MLSQKQTKTKQQNRSNYLKIFNKRRKLLDDKKNVPCADCGVKYPPCVMDFDHVRGEKKFNVGMLLMKAIKKLIEEIDKCEVVCSNCHRLRTFNRKHNPKEAFIK